MADKESRYEKLRRERRYTVAAVDLDIIGRMFLDSELEYSFEGIPKDALFVHADRDIQHQSFSFIYIHESFQPVPEGGMPYPKYLTVHTKKKVTDLATTDSDTTTKPVESAPKEQQ